MSVNMLVLGNPATSFSILIGSIPSDPLYVLSANQQRLYERCYTSVFLADASSVSTWKEISFQKEILAFGRKFGRKYYLEGNCNFQNAILKIAILKMFFSFFGAKCCTRKSITMAPEKLYRKGCLK
jgi:hypothetical protein